MIYLGDLVARMPEEQLRRLVEADPLGDLPADRAALAEALASERRADRLQDQLGVWAKETLRIALLAFAALPFGREALEQAADKEGLPGAGLGTGLSELIRCGIVIAFRKSWGEKLYVLPAELVMSWQSRLPVGIGAFQDNPATGSIYPIGEYKPDAAERLFDLVVFIAKQTPALTKKGALAKRTAEALHETAAAGLDGMVFAQLGFTYPHPDVYPAESALLLDFALRLGLVEVRAGKLCTGPEDRLSAWLRKDRAVMNAELRTLWLKLYAPPDAFSCFVLTELLGFGDSRWLVVREEKRTAAIIAPLLELGWLEAGESDGGAGRFVRWSESALRQEETPVESRPALFVQPDLELLVPPEVSYAVRWELEAFAERIRTDRLTVYRLTRVSVLYALASGRGITRFLSLLEKMAKFGVPDNVRQTVEQWGNAYGKVSVETVTVLRCRDAETAIEIEAIPKLAECLGAKWGETDFPVLSERQENFILLLTEAGYAPQEKHPNAERSTAFPRLADRENIESDTPSCLREGFVQSTSAVLRYEFDQTPEAGDADRVNLSDIPPMWLKEPRSYHGSTGKQMIETAIVCKAMVKLKISGVDRLMTPRRIRETGTSWMLEAFERAEPIYLEPGEWEEMQLIVPGVHDLYYS